MRALPAFAAALLTASLALAGCSASSSDSGDMKAESAAEPAAGRQGAGAAADEDAGKRQTGKGDAVDDKFAKTHVIRTATLSVEVKSVTKALAKARNVALDAGGVVEDETTERIDDTHVASNVVLRVPEAEYDSVLTELAGTGKLLARSANAKDVTEQVVDVNSRIATQRASVNRVRKLMDQAEDITDVVALESQLNTRQSELEALLAKQASLADRTTMATVTLDLSERPKEEKDSGDGDPGFLDALGGGWDALVTVLRWIVVVIAAILPFVAALAVLLGLWLLFGARLRSRRTRTPAPAPVPAGSHAPAAVPDPAPAPAPDADPSPDAGKRD
ncbi:DUF4349 domain-containing protein [Streptomyces sp. IB2014 016-6]|nr:DUF4349 domain-containing protein [Streptomyces sp. IB2014 016-6]TXL89293.1 DUF4349 domain-containing protein [Streptomyces sp. IB2014 016-6]